MTKTAALDNLFSRWRQRYPGQESRFSTDGIIDEERWERSHRRILFLLKETNDYPGDFC